MKRIDEGFLFQPIRVFSKNGNGRKKTDPKLLSEMRARNYKSKVGQFDLKKEQNLIRKVEFSILSALSETTEYIALASNSKQPNSIFWEEIHEKLTDAEVVIKNLIATVEILRYGQQLFEASKEISFQNLQDVDPEPPKAA